MLDPSIIAEAVAILHAARPDAAIILFGSQARGDAREGSDLDLLVIEPVVTARRREMAELADLLRTLCVPVDVVVASRKTFIEWRDTPGTILHAAAKEGKVFHAAA